MITVQKACTGPFDVPKMDRKQSKAVTDQLDFERLLKGPRAVAGQQVGVDAHTARGKMRKQTLTSLNAMREKTPKATY